MVIGGTIMNGMNANVGIGLLAQDIRKMVSFYKDIIGFDTDWDSGLFAEFKTNSGPLSLFIMIEKHFQKW